MNNNNQFKSYHENVAFVREVIGIPQQWWTIPTSDGTIFFVNPNRVGAVTTRNGEAVIHVTDEMKITMAIQKPLAERMKPVEASQKKGGTDNA